MAKVSKADYIWGTTRISLGLVFLWAFFDKLLGLGYATCNVDGVITRGCEKAWLEGGSPTTGFLKFGTDGPLADFYASLAGNVFVDWLFMLGLLGIGLGLTLGIAMKLSTHFGALLMLMMYSAALWPENNPVIDDHIVYALVLVGLWQVNPKQALGMGKSWKKTRLVKDNPWLA